MEARSNFLDLPDLVIDAALSYLGWPFAVNCFFSLHDISLPSKVILMRVKRLNYYDIPLSNSGSIDAHLQEARGDCARTQRLPGFLLKSTLSIHQILTLCFVGYLDGTEGSGRLVKRWHFPTHASDPSPNDEVNHCVGVFF